ncbi:MAG: methyltransferase domain-containing protein [Alphaproteobacteria bacterium]
MAWNPNQYLAFSGQRTRPARELLGRIALESPASIADLGCGPGNSTQALRSRWAHADILGVDNSPQMLARARVDGPDARWLEADLKTWRPDHPVDLVYSNATLQWLDRHEQLFPALMAHVAPAGALAVQMPRNFDAPSHCLLREVALGGTWAAALAPVIRAEPVAAPDRYYDLLAPLSRTLDIWETEYLQVMEGENPVLEWIKGTALVPVLAALDAAAQEAYLAELAIKLRAAYPRRGDGKTLFSFRRIFIIAYR